MGANYFMGTRKGKAKSTGNDYWALMIFRQNRFKSYEVAQCFIDEDFYNHVNGLGLPLGVAVTLSGDAIDGQVYGIEVDRSFAPLNLNQRSASSVQYATNNDSKGGK